MVPKFQKPPACVGCPAYDWGVGFVPPQGHSDSCWAIVGQGPGEQEARTGEPFFENAPSGYRLTRWLYRADFSRRDFFITNVVWCWLPEKYVKGIPKGNRAPRVEEVRFCGRAHWGPALEALPNLEGIIPVGVPAQEAFGLPGGEASAGTLFERDTRTLFTKEAEPCP